MFQSPCFRTIQQGSKNLNGYSNQECQDYQCPKIASEIYWVLDPWRKVPNSRSLGCCVVIFVVVHPNSPSQLSLGPFSFRCLPQLCNCCLPILLVLALRWYFRWHRLSTIVRKVECVYQECYCWKVVVSFFLAVGVFVPVHSWSARIFGFLMTPLSILLSCLRELYQIVELGISVPMVYHLLTIHQNGL